jgi:hypothetical protein
MHYALRKWFWAMLLSSLWAQTGRLFLKVVSSENRPMPYARVETSEGTYTTDSTGRLLLTLPAGRARLRISHIEGHPLETEVWVQAGATTPLTLSLRAREVRTDTLTIQSEKAKPTDLSERPFLQPIPIRTEALPTMPSLKPDLESRLVLMGAHSTNEFSSQYRVRGGNFDENLVYAGDVEIYRPFSARSGQQEGLGFVNPLLIEEAFFSTGGFEARYGDKLSSVLQITYKRRTQPQRIVELGLLSQSIAFIGKKGGVYYAVGGRRFAIGYLLNTLPVKGQYRPVFYDGQAYLSWSRFREDQEKWRIDFLTTGLLNRYRLFPQSGEATFGLVNFALRVNLYFAGAELLRYNTGQTALTLTHRPSARLRLSLIGSFFQSLEDELIDTEGAYFLGEVQTSLGSSLYNEVVVLRGAGSQIRHARNYLDISTGYLAHRGEWAWDPNLRHRLLWGVRGQYESFRDRVYEWSAIDSADYVRLDEGYFWDQRLVNRRLMGFVQQSFRWSRWRIEAGLRAHFAGNNRQLLLTPRLQVLYQPAPRLQYRFGAGFYAQPPFYRELRAIDYRLIPTLRAQQSFQVVGGVDYTFTLWGRPLKYFAEAYYKYLWDLVPYEIENVRLRYYGANLARGYAYGLDMRLNGEFLSGTDSWFSLSLLRTREKPGELPWMRRPSDQRISFAFYFQDELPTNPLYKVNIQFVFASGMPFGVPRQLERRTVFQMPFYNRVDLGLSRVILFSEGRWMRSLWVGIDVFNLFQRYNVVSYQWIADVYGVRWAVPNYLSARLVNVRVIGEF